VGEVALVALTAAGATLVALTRDPGWSAVTVAGLVVGALGSVRRPVLLGSLPLGLAGWCVGLGRDVVATSAWTAHRYETWGRSLLAVAAVSVFTWLAHRAVNRSYEDVDQALAFAKDATVHDPLTGLANRKGLGMLGAQILESARRRGDAVYCMFLDVDGLARVNAELGHAAGDEVLLTVAEALTRSTRATDAVARWGDDEFVVVGPGTGLAPLEMERRVRARCLENSPVARDQWSARISAGGAVLEPWDDGDVDSLLRQADREMHLRRALRREAAAPPYKPVRLDPSPRPPDNRRPAGWPD
jgi:diguanylate cyclase (GGDEF)-like protein